MRRLLRLLTSLVVTVLLLFTAYVTAGRLLMPALTTQKAEIETRLAALLGVPVSIGEIEGTWFRFSPGFRIHDLSLQLNADDPASLIQLSGAELALDVQQSLLGRQAALSLVELSGLRLSLQQLPGGEWTVQGLPPGGGRTRELLLDLLLQTPRISIEDADVVLRFNGGQVLQLQALYLTVNNEPLTGQRHASLQFRPALDVEPVRMRVALDGDPREEFSGTAWLELDGFPLYLPLEEFLPADWLVEEAGTSATLWASFGHEGLDNLTGELYSLNVSGRRVGTGEDGWPLNVSNAGLKFRAQRQQARGTAASAAWLLDIHQLAVDVQNSPVDIGGLRLYLPLEASDTWRLQVPGVAIAPLVQAVLAFPLPSTLQEALQTLAPEGVLENLVLESDRAGAYAGGFSLQGNFRELAVEAWKGAPAGDGLEGYLRVDMDGGMAEIDARNTSLHLPDLFSEAWEYSSLNARVSWALSSAGFRVTSSPIHLRSDSLQGVVQFGLDNTLPGWRSNFPELTLLVGMERMDVAIHAAYLPRLQRLTNTMDWLDAALQTGEISNSMFILRTATGGEPGPVSNTHASWFEVAGAQLRFLEDWPEAAIDSAWVKVQDQAVQVGSPAARISGIDAHNVTARIEPQASGGSLLNLRIDAATSSELGISFLRETPVRDQIGTVLDKWQASGTLGLNVGLAIGLGESDTQQSIDVTVESENSSLYLQDQSLTIDAIEGEIRYDNANGLNASSLTARLFDAPVEIDIATGNRGESSELVTVTSTGKASVAALRNWQGQPGFVRRLLAHVDGELDYAATLDLPLGRGRERRASRLRLQSDLAGVESRLPAPFAKDGDAATDMQLDLEFAPETRQLLVSYGDWLSGDLVLDEGGIDRGYVYAGPLNQNFTIRQTDALDAGLLVSGRVDHFDFDAWRAVGNSLMESAEPGRALSDYLRLVDVDVGELEVSGQSFSDINVQVQFREDAWQIQGRNPLLAGVLQVPADTTRPWQLDLEYLRLPARELPDADASADDEPDLLADVDPAALPAFSFHTDELAIGEHQLGSWRFRLSPSAQGAAIEDLSMQEAASSISGLPPEEEDSGTEAAGARIDWLYEDGQHRSRFEGVFAAGDLARVMPLWGHDANVVSSNADFRGALQWPGSPLAFSLRKASGAMRVHIENGRFVDIDSGSSRLLGAFNFDALVRRLELDFSDLYQRGFSFDDISGELEFIGGVVHARSPLIIDGPSSRLSITGEVDLARETIMADMQVRIPLSENISLLAGLLGAWPIALSTYIAGKIFAEQVEDFTTIIYRLEGPWSDPQAGFEAPEDLSSP